MFKGYFMLTELLILFFNFIINYFRAKTKIKYLQ